MGDSSMLRPVAVDLLAALAPVGIGILLLAGGTRVRRAGPLLYRASVACAVFVVLVLVAAYFTRLKDWTGAYLSFAGGETTAACWSATFLLGVVWTSPGRSSSSRFLAALVGLAVALLFINGGGRLWWRFVAEREWRNSPASDGCLAQTTGWTCAPCAAAMLLHYHGIPTTEGEMAYLSGTSWAGTDLYATADALTI